MRAGLASKEARRLARECAAAYARDRSACDRFRCAEHCVVVVAKHKHSCDVTLLAPPNLVKALKRSGLQLPPRTQLLKVNHAPLAKLRTLFDRHAVTSPAQDDTDRRFHDALYCLLTRYHGAAGHGSHKNRVPQVCVCVCVCVSLFFGPARRKDTTTRESALRRARALSRSREGVDLEASAPTRGTIRTLDGCSEIALDTALHALDPAVGPPRDLVETQSQNPTEFQNGDVFESETRSTNATTTATTAQVSTPRSRPPRHATRA